MSDFKEKLKGLDVGPWRENISLKPFTSMRVGGNAEVLATPTTVEQVGRLLVFCRQAGVPLMTIGNGSNMIVRDGGVAGVVLHTGKLPPSFEISGDSVRAGAGLGLARFVTLCLKEGLTGMEFEVGIPGSIGGALVMNAGCHGEETYDHVLAVCAVQPDGSVRRFDRSACAPRYRGSLFRGGGGVVVAAEFRVSRGDVAEARKRVRFFLEDRRLHQPQGLPNSGSVFKNPPGDFAGRLIEQVGGKGRRLGDAEIAPQHGNFIVNHKDAAAADALGLIRWSQQEVRRRFGIELETEVEIVGSETPAF